MADCRFKITPGGSLTGTLSIPGDKSISHRALIFGALAEGTTKITNFLAGEDPLATMSALGDLGVKITREPDETLMVEGVGLKGFKAAEKPLYLGNSGTSMRLLAGVLAGQSFNSELIGDESLMKRPMARIVEPLRAMGAKISMSPTYTAPLKIQGGQSLHGIHYEMPIASAQVKSGILLAGLYADSDTVLIEKTMTRDHTERMLKAFSYPIHKSGHQFGQRLTLPAGGRLKAAAIAVPGDLSSAAFFILGATIAKGSEVLLTGVGVNPTRIGIINILKQMGANISVEMTHNEPEPIANIRIKSAALTGITIPIEQVSLAIDEFPAIFIAAACARGTTHLTGAAELRHKESDRIETMAKGLKTLRIKVQTLPDGIIIEGGHFQGGSIDSHGDHRVAMAFAMAGLVSESPIEIMNCAQVATSFPNFVSAAKKTGLKIEEIVPIITIDGPSGTGKGTVGRLVAAKMGWHYLDSGALYRVLALASIHENIDLSDELALSTLAAHFKVKFETTLEGVRVFLDQQDVTELLVSEECAEVASKIAALASVRHALLAKQREFAMNPGLVTDGRDMGTVVFQNAQFKIFIDAETQERARRRYFQLQQKGINVSLATILNEIEARDHRDRSRTTSPLRPADDALILDTTHLSIEQVVDRILEWVTK